MRFIFCLMCARLICNFDLCSVIIVDEWMNGSGALLESSSIFYWICDVWSFKCVYTVVVYMREVISELISESLGSCLFLVRIVSFDLLLCTITGILYVFCCEYYPVWFFVVSVWVLLLVIIGDVRKWYVCG